MHILQSVRTQAQVPVSFPPSVPLCLSKITKIFENESLVTGYVLSLSSHFERSVYINKLPWDIYYFKGERHVEKSMPTCLRLLLAQHCMHHIDTLVSAMS